MIKKCKRVRGAEGKVKPLTTATQPKATLSVCTQQIQDTELPSAGGSALLDAWDAGPSRVHGEQRENVKLLKQESIRPLKFIRQHNDGIWLPATNQHMTDIKHNCTHVPFCQQPIVGDRAMQESEVRGTFKLLPYSPSDTNPTVCLDLTKYTIISQLLFAKGSNALFLLEFEQLLHVLCTSQGIKARTKALRNKLYF